ncbi:hypothetical protein Pan110_21830 [Gimesia panareensis]|nr:hypothetical protein Pan110_21830 [Gimesia panareensis]
MHGVSEQRINNLKLSDFGVLELSVDDIVFDCLDITALIALSEMNIESDIHLPFPEPICMIFWFVLVRTGAEALQLMRDAW